MVIISDAADFIETLNSDEDVSADKSIKNISYLKSSKKYIIRKTKNKITYYYGSFNNSEECNEVCYFLNRMNFPVSYSENNNNYSGEDYIKWLKNELKKNGFNIRY